MGVVSDAIHGPLREPRRPALYEPLAQNDWPRPFPGISLSVRSVEQARRCYFGGAAKKQL